jgi:FAD/FMN-containing dehydrogenase
VTQSLEVDELRTTMSGTVLDPTSADYDEARRVWNADHDRRPLVIARCGSTADVVAAVNYARERGLEIAVRGGGHSVSGVSTVDDGVLIDLRQLNQVTVDPIGKRAVVGGGALLAELDAATQEHGLALPVGLIGHTGVGGLTLGGGMGWLTRRAGLTVDSMLSAEVVTADGRVLRASERENPDLFWALRGGGGNFGVVTEFEFRLHEAGPMVHFGLLFWGVEQGKEVLLLAERLAATLPRDMNVMPGGLNAPPEPFVPEPYQLRPGFALLLVGFGTAEQHAEVVDQVRRELPPLFDFVTPMPYVALQQMFDEPNCWGQYYHEKSVYLERITDDVATVIAEQVPRKSSPLSLMLIYRLDQAYTEVGELDTAFSGGRTARWSAFFIAACPTPELLPADRAWVRGCHAALRPLSMDDTAYVNGVSTEDEHRVRRSYGPERWDRLTEIKGRYDPGNLFHRNVNIKPL